MLTIVYNLRRIGNILTREVLKEYLRILISLFQTVLDLPESVLMNFEALFFPRNETANKNGIWLKSA